MIRIDHISFEFAAPDEGFVQALYADWDGFCHRCFERVAEEILTPYGDDRMLHELERLDLDLGAIPEENFYDEYPRRLREALLSALPSLQTLQERNDPKRTASARRDNLLFYLEHGHPLPEWADEGFNPQEETEWIVRQPSGFRRASILGLARLCLKQEHALRRLLWQTGNGRLLPDLFTAILAEPSAGQAAKGRLLALLLEERPEIPVRFVHQAPDDTALRGMSVLLDTLSVKSIIREETKEHAEVDLPPYWHYLYEWLVKYYPYNGIAMFGGKAEFIRHLHHRLLTFIRKRSGAPYLSKAELTAGFLLEVFGPAYYKDVLNAIYLLQPHNPDGSPVYDSYFNRELYRMFLRLSLLHLPEATEEDKTVHENRQNAMLLPDGAEAFSAWLKDTSQSRIGKREQLAMLAKEHPELLVKWLQTESRQDDALLSLLAELADDATLYRLIASLSSAASETEKAVQAYIKKHRQETGWLKGLSDTRLATVFRLSAFRWLAGDKDDAENLLRTVYRETGGKEEDAAMETLAGGMERGNVPPGQDERNAGILHLQILLSDPMLPDMPKRRRVARFWDSYREDHAQAVRLLEEHGLLPEAMRLTGRDTWAELVRRMTVQVFGKDAASGILLLLERLTAQEDSASRYLIGSRSGIRGGILLWLARQGENYTGTRQREAARSLLTFLFGKGNVPLVLKQTAQENVSESEDAEQLWGWLENTSANKPRALQTAYREWKHSHESASETLRTLFESRWHTAEGFAGWLYDPSRTIHDKRDLLREAAIGKASEWPRLLRALPEGSKVLASLGTMLTTQDLLGSIAQANFHQASVLSRVVERLRHPSIGLPVSLMDGGIPLETFLRRALLAYLQDPEALGRTLGEREITDRFLSYLRLAATGKGHDGQDAAQWRQLAESVADNPSGNADGNLVRRITGRPDELLAWIEQEADRDGISRLAELSDGLTARHWADRLAAMPGFAHPDAFRRLTAWLLRRMPVPELAVALFLYVKEPGWRTFTPEQMETYFFSRLYGKSHALPAQETLADESLPETIRKRLFRHYLRHRPDRLLAFIRKAVLRNALPLGRWLERTEASDWLQLAAGLSLAKAELLRQTVDCLSLPETERKQALATFLLYDDTEDWPYETPQETVRDFVETLPSMQGQAAETKSETVQKIEAELSLHEEKKTPEAEESPELLPVPNAGLCLLAPWFARLFAMLGYLDEERKGFRNRQSKIRAVFLLQYLAFGKERKWREAELAFNRLLTALPGHVPLPNRLRLTGREKKTADGMVAGVKANWPQMNGTSPKSFRQSFLARHGQLERQDERWLLTVEEKAYDLLLDTVPWGFRQIRLPWLKKHVQVKWKDKQMF